MRARDISKYIIEGLLGEEIKEKVAIYGGSFRPPTKSDYQLIEKAIEEDPTIDKFIIYVGDSKSEGLNQSDAIKIWEMYKKHLPRDLFVFRADPSPVQAVYNYSDNNPHKEITWLFGVREGNSEDFAEVAKRTTSISDYPNIIIKPIVFDSNITEREIMAAANMGRSELEKYLPQDLTYKEIDEIYEMLKPKQLNEEIYEYADDIVEKIIDEGWEFIEIMGGLAQKAARVAYSASRDKKKYFTLGYERDSTTNPPINMVNVFWSNEGDGPRRDIIDGGTMQDYEDIVNAAKSNINESSGKDLKEEFYTSPDPIIDKLSENDWVHIDYRGIPGPDGKSKQDALAYFSRRDNKNYFTATYDTSRSFFDSDLIVVYYATKDGLKTRDIITYAAESELELITKHNVLESKENTLIKEAVDANFEDIIDKIVEGGYYYIPTKASFHSTVTQNFIEDISKKTNKPQYSFAKFKQELDKDRFWGMVYFSDDRTRYTLRELSSEDVEEIENSGNVNIEGFRVELPLKPEEYDKRKDRLNKLLSLYKEAAKINEAVAGDKIVCDNCGWDWKIKDGGDDLYMCHKCGHDNTPKSEDKSDTPPIDSIDHYGDIMMFMNGNGLKLEPFPSLEFIDNDEDNAEDLFGKTAYYDPKLNHIVLYTYGRHPKDILRSFAHELVHVHQNHEGRLDNINTTNTNEDDHLEQIEREAYEKGNILFRKWSDQMKEGKKDYGIDAYSAELARLRENKLTVNLVIKKPFVVYCDLNNVLSDGGEDELNWNDEGKTLWDYIKKYDVTILSNDSNVNNKINWINENLPERKSYIFKNKDEKQFYARVNTILIDNREETIDNWIEAGGIGIVYHTTRQTIDHLKQLGL